MNSMVFGTEEGADGAIIWPENRLKKSAKSLRGNYANVKRFMERHALHNSVALDPNLNYGPNRSSNDGKARAAAQEPRRRRSSYTNGADYGSMSSLSERGKTGSINRWGSKKLEPGNRDESLYVQASRGRGITRRISRREILEKASRSSSLEPNPSLDPPPRQTHGRAQRRSRQENISTNDEKEEGIYYPASSGYSSTRIVLGGIPRPSTLPKSANSLVKFSRRKEDQYKGSVYNKLRRNSSLPMESSIPENRPGGASRVMLKSKTDYGAISKKDDRRPSSGTLTSGTKAGFKQRVEDDATSKKFKAAVRRGSSSLSDATVGRKILLGDGVGGAIPRDGRKRSRESLTGSSILRGRRASAHERTYATIRSDTRTPVRPSSSLRAGTDRRSSTFPKSTSPENAGSKNFTGSKGRGEKLERQGGKRRASFFSLFSKPTVTRTRDKRSISLTSISSSNNKPDERPNDRSIEELQNPEENSIYSNQTRKSSRTLLGKISTQNSNTLPTWNRRPKEMVPRIPVDVPLYVRTTYSEEYSRYSSSLSSAGLKFRSRESAGHGVQKKVQGHARAFSEIVSSNSNNSLGPQSSIFGLCTGRRKSANGKKPAFIPPAKVLAITYDEDIFTDNWKVNTVSDITSLFIRHIIQVHRPIACAKTVGTCIYLAVIILV